MRALLIVVLLVTAMPWAQPACAQDSAQAQIKLIWPDADHVRPPGRYRLQGSYEILDPSIEFANAGFIINNTPYDAGDYNGANFALRPTFQPGEYLIEAYIVDTSGQMLPGEAHRLYIREGTANPPPAEAPIAEPAPVSTAPATTASMDPAFKGEGLKAYIEFDAPIDGQPWGSFLSFPPTEPGLTLEPTITWQGTHFEAFLKYQKPASEIWDDSRKTIAKLHWDFQYRVYGNIAADQQSLEGITVEYKGECRTDNDKLWEYYEGHYALTHVPGQGRVTSSNNPLSSSPPTYLVEYRIDGSDRSTLDHVLEFSYRHGYPASPETQYQVSAATLTRVNFTFTGW